MPFVISQEILNNWHYSPYFIHYVDGRYDFMEMKEDRPGLMKFESHQDAETFCKNNRIKLGQAPFTVKKIVEI